MLNKIGKGALQPFIISLVNLYATLAPGSDKPTLFTLIM